MSGPCISSGVFVSFSNSVQFTESMRENKGTKHGTLPSEKFQEFHSASRQTAGCFFSCLLRGER